ncbi:MAG: hypothetical protein GMKNLPBB_01043 [Myxococcota bacterium]|nr:hypothetical protein [Myxococcota bacterium]
MAARYSSALKLPAVESCEVKRLSDKIYDRLPGFLVWLFDHGVDPSAPAADIRAIRISNVISLTAAVILFSWSFVGFALNQPAIAVMRLVMVILYLATWWINSTNRGVMVYVLSTSLGIATISGMTLQMGEGSYIHVYYGLTALGILLSARRNENLACNIMLGVNLLANTGVYALLPYFTPAFVMPAELRWLNQINVPMMVMFTMVVASYYRNTILITESQLEIERERSERLIKSVLPESIARRLKESPDVIADGHSQVSVLFADLVNFTTLSQTLSAHDVVDMLNEIFFRFDELCARHGLEKIKTIGDAYMAAAGIPDPRGDHAEAAVELGLAMQRELDRFNRERNLNLQLRIGAHSGPAVAGVIGKNKFIYDLWGHTVNTAARMESHGVPGHIQFTRETWEAIRGKYPAEARGEIHIKGIGPLETWLMRA